MKSFTCIRRSWSGGTLVVRRERLRKYHHVDFSQNGIGYLAEFTPQPDQYLPNMIEAYNAVGPTTFAGLTFVTDKGTLTPAAPLPSAGVDLSGSPQDDTDASPI